MKKYVRIPFLFFSLTALAAAAIDFFQKLRLTGALVSITPLLYVLRACLFSLPLLVYSAAAVLFFAADRREAPRKILYAAGAVCVLPELAVSVSSAAGTVSAYWTRYPYYFLFTISMAAFLLSLLLFSLYKLLRPAVTVKPVVFLFLTGILYVAVYSRFWHGTGLLDAVKYATFALADSGLMLADKNPRKRRHLFHGSPIKGG